MNSFAKVASFILIACLTPQLYAAESRIPAASEYAYGWEINTPGQSGFYELIVPLEVYRSSADNRIRDLGVYDSFGNPIPRVVFLPPEDRPVVEERFQLNFLPLYVTTKGDPQNLRLLVEQKDARTMVSLNTQERVNEESTSEEALTSYIVDTRKIQQRINHIELFWPNSLGPFIGQVAVHGSDDLETWSQIGSGSIASLSDQGTAIEQRKISISNASYDFLQLTWGSLPDDWRVLALEGISSSSGDDRSRERLLLDVSQKNEDENSLIYDVSGSVLADQVSLTLPKEISVLNAEVFAWNSRQADWRRVHSGMFYDFRDYSEPMVNPPQSISPVRASRWKVVVKEGTALADVKLEIGWKPDKLVFVAQGSAPYQLVAGRASDALDGFPQTKLNDSAILGLADNGDLVATAALGPRFALAGPQQLEQPFSPEWGTWATWAGLIAGVLFVGFMALSLLRQMKS